MTRCVGVGRDHARHLHANVTRSRSSLEREARVRREMKSHIAGARRDHSPTLQAAIGLDITRARLRGEATTEPVDADVSRACPRLDVTRARIINLQVGDSSLDIDVERQRNGVGVKVRNARNSIAVTSL